ncbi:hypothetical protein [Streptomyces sp. ITFR-16]|uniref:hypothetical protein n=1 Tax=Streptomyces sp. ITFR-16 TaxID=3075198 RepID=UPI00288A1C55|nr:hypothetical protein [Streptomyces sp. ITFR-16]WNI26401.1 hypothetical protein RLT58_32980 [Streptomyces sp. ITFR-16]
MDTSRREPHALRTVAFVLAALCTLVMALTATARSTVVSPSFYRSVLDDRHAYDRLYDEVLVDPRASGVTRDLLARLPVPEAIVTSNLKVVLPPETVRDLTHQQIDGVVGYLRGDLDTLRLTVDLRPVAGNLGDLTQIYFGDLVASLQNRPEPDFAAFSADLEKALDGLVAGRIPEGLPALPLSEAQARQATDALLRSVPAEAREALRPEVSVALAEGDVATALAAVAPAAVSERTRASAAELRATVGGGTWDITEALAASGNDLDAVHRARVVTHEGLGLVEALASVLGVASLAVLWFASPAGPGRRLSALGAALLSGAVLTGSAVLLARLVTGGRVVTPPDSWPPGLTGLVDDLQGAAFDRIALTALTTALVPFAIGALLAAVGWAVRVRPRASLTAPRVRGLAAGAGCAAMAGVLLVPVGVNRGAAQICQGSAKLCGLRYDEVAEVTSHNANATTYDRFIGPLQDPSVTAQLDAGARALQIDTYHWETSREITQRLDTPEFSPEQRRLIGAAIDRLNPPRAGLWLCHAVCRAGAVEMVPALAAIGDWMREHPTEVVTLIIQDAISGEDTERAFRQAGIDDLVHTPDPDPAKPWPTLGEMTGSGRRLVVFAEEADGPAPWYRNFYRYGMETPFAFRSPGEMTCVPHRGGTGKRLFLLNHFVTDAGGSRIDAGKVNARDWVLDRVRRCERERGRPVNFVAVDYTTIGDVRGAVDALNEERAAASGGS